MIVDSSALIAILKAESDAHYFGDILSESAGDISLSAANYLETGIVIDGLKHVSSRQRLDDLLEAMEISISPVTEQQAKIARVAYSKYGKGSGHKAKLNFGDCFAYALAIDTDRPLLFKGNDFAQTDVKLASA